MSIKVPGQPDEDVVVDVTVAETAKELLEAAEIVELRFQVVGSVDYLGESAERFRDMPLIGLDQYLREKLGLGKQDTGIGKMVEVVGTDGTVRQFIVVKGSAKLLDNHDSFCANGINPGEQVKVRKSKIELEKDEYEVLRLLEILGDEEKRALRKHVIATELGLDPNRYLTIPKSLASQLGITEKFVPQKVKIKAGDNVFEMAVMLTKGDAIGFTTDAAKQIGLSNETPKIHMLVQDGMLVVE